MTADRPRGRLAAVLGGGGLAITLLAIALVFATSKTTAQLGDDAVALHWANAVDGSAAIARAGVAQAVAYAGFAEATGAAADEDAVAAASEEAWLTIDDLRVKRALVAAAPDGVDATAIAVVDEIDSLLVDAAATLNAVDSGDVGDAVAIFHEELEPAYADLSARLDAAQAVLRQQIESTKNGASTLGLITQILATLLIPAAAIVVYYLFARRQYREASVRMAAKLQAERELSMAKDDFIAGVSHELRTPLTGIYGFSEYLIEQGIIDPDEAMELIGHINQEASELSRMVEDLLSAARLDSDALSLEPTPTEVGAEVALVAAPMQRAGASISIDGGSAWAQVDPIRLRQIARNLLSNAVKHGGSHIRVSIDNGDDHVVITVADNGDGVGDGLKHRLFDRFVHDANNSLLAGSVGLGLSIARSLARRMGGDVTYLRAVGWTNFVVTLPKADVEIAEPEEVPPILRLHRVTADDAPRRLASVHAIATSLVEPAAGPADIDLVVRFD